MQLGPYTLDARARRLVRGVREIHLSPKAFDLLLLLAERSPEALAKAEIHQRLWPDTFVADGSLAVLVAEIRTALGDSARAPRFIRTVQRFGYAFVGAVDKSLRGSASAHEAASACWLAWGNRRATLALGKNIVGRDPEADVCIDAVGVSRRHALIVVAAEEATIADLSSKNGTFVNGVRVTDPVALQESTEIRLGPVPVRFCRHPAAASTQTWNASRTGPLP